MYFGVLVLFIIDNHLKNIYKFFFKLYSPSYRTYLTKQMKTYVFNNKCLDFAISTNNFSSLDMCTVTEVLNLNQNNRSEVVERNRMIKNLGLVIRISNNVVKIIDKINKE